MSESLVSRYFTDEHKPLCVLGAVNNANGYRISQEMREWLQPHFNLFVVSHDGTMYEYPALAFLQSLITSGDYDEPVFYVHTKGAFHSRPETEAVRDLWRREFVGRQYEYLKAVDMDEPLMAAPYSGMITEVDRRFVNESMVYPSYFAYENGWVANAEAIRRMEIRPSNNRYWFEMCMYRDIRVIGLIRDAVNLKDIPARREITRETIESWKR